MAVTGITSSEPAKAKRAFTTRRIPLDHMKAVVARDVKPKVGDVVLVTVDKIGSHTKLELRVDQDLQARCDRHTYSGPIGLIADAAGGAKA